MASVRHRRAGLNGLEVYILLANDGVTITRASGQLFHDADITSVKNGTGDYTLTINPFKGPAGEVYAQATVQTTAGTKLFANVVTPAYTNDSLALRVQVFADTGTATDSAVQLHLYAE